MGSPTPLRCSTLSSTMCLFHAETVSFLGFRVAPVKIEADPEKVREVVEWPQPSTRRKLQQFLGFAHFHWRVMRNYSQIAAPLTRLKSPKERFRWDAEAEAAFKLLKAKFAEESSQMPISRGGGNVVSTHGEW